MLLKIALRTSVNCPPGDLSLYTGKRDNITKDKRAS